MVSVKQLCVLTCAVVLVMATLAMAADSGKPDTAASLVMRFTGTHRGAFFGSPALILDVVSPLTGRHVDVAVPNDPPMGPYHPSPAAMKWLDTIKLNDLVDIKFTIESGGNCIQSLSLYKAKPGEDAPNGFIFSESKQETVSGHDVMSVVLQKFGQSSTVSVAAKPGENGKPQPDPALVSTIATLKSGDVVTAEVRASGSSPTLLSIELYTEPLKGEFVKVTDSDIDGVKYPAIEIKTATGNDTILLPGIPKNGKWEADPKMLAKARDLRAGKAVDYRVKQDNGKTYLKDITLVSVSAAASH